MKLLELAAAALLGGAAFAPTNAAVVLSDNFDAENAGLVALNYTGFANFTVTGGSVDLVTSSVGIACLGGGGSCVDLDGSSNAGGTLTTAANYAFNAGDMVTLSIDLGGNQRGGASDEFSFGFNTSVATLFNNVIVTGPFGPAPVNVGNLGPGLFLGSGRPTGALGLVAPGEPFTTYSISFVAGNAGTLTAFAATASADNVGPILDNFVLSIGGGTVPEPATWGLMIAGFAMTGFAARRRRGTVVSA